MASKAVETRIKSHLKDYDEAYLLCRFRRHRWEWEGFYRSRHDGSRYVVSVFVCDSCTMRREDYLNVDGTLASRHYGQPEGYLFKYDAEEREENRRVGIVDVIKTMYARSDIYDTEEDLLANRR